MFSCLVGGEMVGLGVMALAALSVRRSSGPASQRLISRRQPQLGFGKLSGNLPGNNNCATRQAGEPLILKRQCRRRFGLVSWTARLTEWLRLTRLAATSTRSLGVYVGTSLSNLIPVKQDNNGSGGVTSKVTFNAPAGAKFYISVDGSNGVQGNIVLRIGRRPNPTLVGSNDVVAQATTLAGDSGTLFDYNVFATAEGFEQSLFGPSLFRTDSMVSGRPVRPAC